MPGGRLIVASHVLAEVGQAVVEIGMRAQSPGF